MQNTAKSLLKVVKEKTEYVVKNLLEKGFKIFQQKAVEKTAPLIEKEIDKPLTAQRMYINQCLIKYSKDKDLFEKIMSMTPKELRGYLKNKDNKIINFDSFSDDTDTKRFPPIPYGGGKQNHKTKQQSLVASYLLSNPNINAYYEMFVGGFGSVYNSLPILLEFGIKDIYLSDVNKSLINLYRHIQRNPKQVQRHLASIDLECFQFFGKYYPDTREEGKEMFDYIHSEFSKLEEQNKMNPKRAAYFMYLVSNTQGGMLKYDMKRKINKMTFTFDPNKLKKVALLINKVEIFHQIFNVANINFSVKKYETVHNKIKNETNILVLHDSPYAEFTTDMKKDLKTDGYNYGTDFEQEPLLKKIKNSKYPVIYYNNHNPIIEEFSNVNNFNYLKMDVIYNNGTKGRECIEILMFSDRKSITKPSINRDDYMPNKIQKVS